MSNEPEELEDELALNTETEEVEEQVDTSDAEARAQGWRPFSEFNGDPDDWVDSKAFLEKGERNAPMMRERNRKLASTVETQRQELADLKRRQDLSDKMQEKLFARARDEALEKIRQEQKAAVENGDVAKYEAAEARRDKVSQEFKPEPEDRQPQGKPVEIQRFEDDNEWYNEDVIMQGAANALHGKIIREFPNLSLAKQLAKVKEGIIDRFPDKFENQRRNNQSANIGGKPKGQVKKTKGWDDVPEKDREWAERSLKRSGVSKQTWAKEYWDLSNI